MNSFLTAFLSSRFYIFLLICFSSVNAETGKFKLGVSAPLTGDLAEYGSAVRNGIDFAIKESPDKFKHIQFVFEDNQYDSSEALAAFHKLCDVDKVNLIYNWGEPPLHAIASIAELKKLPIVAMSLDPEPSRGKKYIIRSINPSDHYAKALVNYLRKNGLKKIAILKTEDPFMNSMVEGLKKYLVDGETLSVFGTFSSGENDFKVHIAKLNRSDFDVVGVYLFPGQISAFYRQAGGQKFHKPTFGTDMFESKDEIQKAGGGMIGAVYPNLDVPLEFHTKYLEKFGTDTQIAYAYNANVFANVAADVAAGVATGVLANLEENASSDAIISSFLHPTQELPFLVRGSLEEGQYYEFPILIKKIEGKGFIKLD